MVWKLGCQCFQPIFTASTIYYCLHLAELLDFGDKGRYTAGKEDPDNEPKIVDVGIPDGIKMLPKRGEAINSLNVDDLIIATSSFNGMHLHCTQTYIDGHIECEKMCNINQ